MDVVWWVVLVVFAVVWYAAVGRLMAWELRRRGAVPNKTDYTIWAVSPILAVFVLFWYIAWLVSGGLVRPPHKVLMEDE